MTKIQGEKMLLNEELSKLEELHQREAVSDVLVRGHQFIDLSVVVGVGSAQVAHRRISQINQ
jgi:hypothetical protein